MRALDEIWANLSREELAIAAGCLAVVGHYLLKVFGVLERLVGIRKNLLTSKKTAVEIEKASTVSRVSPATLEDVKRYDVKAKTIMEVASRESEDRARRVRPPTMTIAWSHRTLAWIALAIIIAILFKASFL